MRHLLRDLLLPLHSVQPQCEIRDAFEVRLCVLRSSFILQIFASMIKLSVIAIEGIAMVSVVLSKNVDWVPLALLFGAVFVIRAVTLALLWLVSR